MPVLSKAGVRIDYADEGIGPPVVLIHSSVSANRQWRALTEALRDRYRVLAPNLYGYGETTPWPGVEPQSLAAQAELVLAVCDELDGPVRLVGHSLGGSVALKSALLLGDRASSLVLLEPNPFHLLNDGEHMAAWRETQELRELVTGRMAAGDWPGAAQPFADYWLGEGAWNAMPERRQAAFVESLPPNLHEWDAVGNEQTGIEGYAATIARTLVLSDRGTRRPIREIVQLFAQGCPAWTFRYLDEGGHMAPLTRPELVNPLVEQFLDAE
ncbi:MAG TPA: alpha/beta hydrolase [Gaiellales bacterium]|nr:alpha/beta hydrolase [Gaiellales bacterium]